MGWSHLLVMKKNFFQLCDVDLIKKSSLIIKKLLDIYLGFFLLPIINVAAKDASPAPINHAALRVSPKYAIYADNIAKTATTNIPLFCPKC